MEPITKADLKDLLAEWRAELRGVIKQSVKESISVAFGNYKPAVDGQTSGRQVSVDLLQHHVCCDKGNNVEEPSMADPPDSSALAASTTPPTATCDVIPVLAAASAAPTPTTERSLVVTPVVPGGTVTPGVVERGPEVVLTASTGFMATMLMTCSTECSPQQRMSVPVLVASWSQAVTGVVPNDTTTVVHVFCLAKCATQVITEQSPTPAIRMLPLPWASGSSSSHPSSKPRPIPWPSFVVPLGDVHLAEPWPPLQGTSENFPNVSCVLYHFPGSLSWMSPVHICLQCELHREENVTSVSMRMNILENFLTKPYIESIGITVSGLISRRASVFQQWCIPWSIFLFLGLTSADRYDLALFQWEIAWKLDTTEWALQPWDSGQQADFPYDQFSCADHYTSCFPINFHSVVILGLQIGRGGSPCVYLQKLKMDKSGIDGATFNSVSINMNCCRLKWSKPSLARSVDMDVYYSSVFSTSGGTICEYTLASTTFSFAWAYVICFSNSEVCALLVGFLRSGTQIKSEMSRHAGTNATDFVIAVGISSSSMMRFRFGTLRLSRVCAGHDWLSHGFILISWLEEQQLPPITSSIPNNMFRNAEFSNLLVCELWLLNHQDMTQLQWQPRAHACLIMIELSSTHTESGCFLCQYHGRPALLLFLAFYRQAVFQGGRCAMIPIICYLAHDNYSDFPDSQASNGFKFLHVPWDPGVCIVALSATFQGHSTSHFMEPRLEVKPCFKEGGVSATFLYIDLGWNLGPSSWAWSTYQHEENYKYASHGNEEGIQVGSRRNGTGGSFLPTWL